MFSLRAELHREGFIRVLKHLQSFDFNDRVDWFRCGPYVFNFDAAGVATSVQHVATKDTAVLQRHHTFTTQARLHKGFSVKEAVIKEPRGGSFTLRELFEEGSGPLCPRLPEASWEALVEKAKSQYGQLRDAAEERKMSAPMTDLQEASLQQRRETAAARCREMLSKRRKRDDSNGYVATGQEQPAPKTEAGADEAASRSHRASRRRSCAGEWGRLVDGGVGSCSRACSLNAGSPTVSERAAPEVRSNGE